MHSFTSPSCCGKERETFCPSQLNLQLSSTLSLHVSLSPSLIWFINTWERTFLPLITRSNVLSVGRQSHWALFKSSPFDEECGTVTDRAESVTMWTDATRTIRERADFVFVWQKINKEDGAVCYLGSDKMSTSNSSALRMWSASFILWSSRVTSTFRRRFFF